MRRRKIFLVARTFIHVFAMRALPNGIYSITRKIALFPREGRRSLSNSWLRHRQATNVACCCLHEKIWLPIVERPPPCPRIRPYVPSDPEWTNFIQTCLFGGKCHRLINRAKFQVDRSEDLNFTGVENSVLPCIGNAMPFLTLHWTINRPYCACTRLFSTIVLVSS